MKDFTKLLTNNKMATLIVSLLIVLYSALAAPALPNSVILFFDTWLGKLLFMFLIGFVASHNIQVALVISILFFVILNLATKLEVENFKEQQKEHFEEQKTEQKSPDLSSVMNNKLKEILCKMVKQDAMPDMSMNVRDYASKNMDKITKALGISKEALNSMLENTQNIPNTTLDKLCEVTQVPTEGFEDNNVLIVNPADPMEEVGAPVDF
jgi:hypothetical protein